MLVNKLCEICKTPLIPNTKWPIKKREAQRFCSNTCNRRFLSLLNSSRKGTHPRKKQKICEVCGIRYYPEKKIQKYHNQDCMGKAYAIIRKGTVLSEETKKRLSLALKGKKKPESHGRHVSEALRGRIVSEETKRKLSKAMVGNKNSVNRILSEETKRKIGEKSLGRNLGVSPSIEARIKSSLAQRGEKNHNWQGGLTEIQHLIRSSMVYDLWRKAILGRDQYTCVLCSVYQHWDKEKKVQIKVQADHIITFSSILEKYNIRTLEEAINCKELWEINNGRTLCEDCHRETETWGIKALKFKKNKSS